MNSRARMPARETLVGMRAFVSLALPLTTSCSFALSEAPGPRCVETGADVADAVTAVSSGVLAILVTALALDQCQDGCNNREDTQLVIGAAGLALASGAFTASAVHGSRRNAACRRARGLPDE